MSGAAAWGEWRARRLARATDEYGIASLDRTVWLSNDATHADGLPGSWRLVGDDVVGDDVDGSTVRILPGDTASVGVLRVRNVGRHGARVLRIFDPASANRTTIVDIDSYPYDPAWRVEGRFRASGEEERVEVVDVDGGVTLSRVAGVVDLATPAGDVTLTVTVPASGGYSAVIGDATNGTETYRFRFLDLSSGLEGDVFTVDLNRAYLPPCAFSPEYVCPLPLPGNRWDIPVRAGERTVQRAA